MDILIASHNVHKIREMREMCKHFRHLHFLSLLDFPLYVAPEENLENLKEIAIAKALHAAKNLGLTTIADDSGLFVPTLDKNGPGVRSRRYASESATDIENRKKLLSAMSRMEGVERAAYFECCLALALPEKLKKCVIGTCHGEISTEEKGGNGFGYDPLFIKDGYHQTFAELSTDLKNRISHRHNALQKLLPDLEILNNASC